MFKQFYTLQSVSTLNIGILFKCISSTICLKIVFQTVQRLTFRVKIDATIGRFT